ncbi:polycystic kidney disease protein 1-like 2, partial [Limulus polyphemus]|uniref:Polycystic kidney disease protein 1-like 2 n=1 Tax=Limulus polyphemus TaxID=6850 RepID=A0ABM1RZE1_LIMPO
MVYHQLIVAKADSAVNIEITPTNPETELLLFLKHREKPLYNSYDLLISLSAMTRKNDTFELFLPNDMINNRTGFFYLGIIEVNLSLPLDFDIDGPVNATAGDVAPVNLTSDNVIREFSTNYSLRIYTSGCYFYDYELKIWSGSGCYVHSANSALTHCKCNHLTSFGSGFFVTPNTIDFSYVFANAGFADNVTIYMTIIVTLLIYVLLMIWARVKDKKDVEK